MEVQNNETHLKSNKIGLTLVECILYLHQYFFDICNICLSVSDLILVYFKYDNLQNSLLKAVKPQNSLKIQ